MGAMMAPDEQEKIGGEFVEDEIRDIVRTDYPLP